MCRTLSLSADTPGLRGPWSLLTASTQSKGLGLLHGLETLAAYCALRLGIKPNKPRLCRRLQSKSHLSLPPVACPSHHHVSPEIREQQSTCELRILRSLSSRSVLKMPQSLGALGGKPNNAYYFIGFLGKKRVITSKSPRG